MSTCNQVWYYTSQNFWILTRDADFITNPNTKDKYQELVLHAANAYNIKPAELEESDNSNCTYDYIEIKYPTARFSVPLP